MDEYIFKYLLILNGTYNVNNLIRLSFFSKLQGYIQSVAKTEETHNVLKKSQMFGFG